MKINSAKPEICSIIEMSPCYCKELLHRTTQSYLLSTEEAVELYRTAPLASLMQAAHLIRSKINNPEKVTWIIDRNVNYTNVCLVHCKFCNFCTVPNFTDAYTLAVEDFDDKIDALFRNGGNQLLLQGGLNPALGLDYYISLFKALKQRYPTLKLHALGPPEIVFLSKKEGIGIGDTLKELVRAGLDSLPGAGAEILSDRVRKLLSPSKCNADEWIEVMRQAHRIGLTTTATMMFGHIETIEERMEHLSMIRNLQLERPPESLGFIAFIPWPCSLQNTRLLKWKPELKPVSASEYIRMIAISRIFLQNIAHIQASWLTVGAEVGALCLHAGADDLGSIMIEENVLKATGVANKLDAVQMQELIKQNGFVPVQRNQDYDAIQNPL